MRWKKATLGAGLAAFVIVAAQACAPRGGVESWDPSRDASSRELGRSLVEPNASAGESRNNTLEALNKILASPKLSAFDRSIYLSIRAYQLSKLGREADSQKDIAEMGKVLPAAWPLVLSGTLPELAGGGDRAAALRTLDSALAQKPGDSWLVIAQAQVFMQIADFQRAHTLLDEALASATAADRRIALYYRGHANFNLGNYAASADDFDATLEGRTGRARLAPILWRYAALVRAQHDARGGLAKAVAGESLDDWPGPIVKFLLGRLPVGELEVIAESDEGAKRANGKCPAALFIGLDALRRGDRQRARDQLQLAQARCPTMSEFNWAATSELKRL
jgi:tetratricopeptide (TPR) repeat protein